jgi:methanogenic corrinoid protein MtbC1
MILAAEAVKAAIVVLKPALRARVVPGAVQAPCVLGTVKGDIHDIGKNIVGTMLEAFGFTIVDLGTDVDPAHFVGAVREVGAGLVGISALLTSTMPEMRSVVDALREAGLRSRVRIAVGGAPVTPEFAKEIGADGTAADGISALRLFQRLAGERLEDRDASCGGAASVETRHAS